MDEYSFFRAKGRSLTAILTMFSAQEEVRQLSEQLAKRYGARSFYISNLRWENGLVIRRFIFAPGDLPPDFIETGRVREETPQEEIYARPAFGAEPYRMMASVVHALEPLLGSLTLDDVLGCGRMPVKHLPAGHRLPFFVRQRSLLDQTVSNGILTDGTALHGACGPGIVSDPVVMERLMGQYYIRVPNDENGQPRFTPPDAEVMAYEDMLKLDTREFYKRNPGKTPPKGMEP